MMSATSWRFDPGQSSTTKGFPARTLLGRNREGAGHWLVAHRKALEQNYRSLRRRIEEHKEDNSVTHNEGNTLDGPLLLRLKGVDRPSELCSVDISEQNLTSVNLEDMKMFDSVAYIEAYINSLSLGSFSSFVSLREINLSVNGIRNMTFDAADFPHLEVLNLSYNYLSADDVVAVGRLKRLKVLHLTGNRLHHLPLDLGSTRHDAAASTEEDDAHFGVLEVLMLDDNKLGSSVFCSLTSLRRLKHLNLQGNLISEVPFLLQTSAEEQTKDQGLAHSETESNSGEASRWTSEKETSEESPALTSKLPLPELQFLNLADNQIADEESVMSVALFPKLCEIDICSNPLTTKRKGEPPLLTHHLQHRLGITITRKKVPDVERPPLKVPGDPRRKVENRIPDVLRKPSMDAARPAKTQPERREEAARESFFVTQAADVSNHDLQPDEKQAAVNKASEGEYDWYQTLTDPEQNPEASEPVGIQTAVRMLEHTLKNPNVYRDSKAKLDSIQAPYRGAERRIKPLPPSKPVKKPAEQVDDLMKEVKRSTTRSQVSLSRVLRGDAVDRRDYEEALSLLSQYRTVHERTMQRVAGVELNGDAGSDQAYPGPAQRF